MFNEEEKVMFDEEDLMVERNFNGSWFVEARNEVGHLVKQIYYFSSKEEAIEDFLKTQKYKFLNF